ncbi:uncharacterized protein BCR38DRAFT_509936 [Pseudomassariella vexata]|uniref:Uncharacterized protein n=1 Tax=Pseudomassariella vexata TaxID=1141098 RepID=A0A1Y2E7B4_9PEZI|nr:uncharacterized protein BCR38DRAFT_509936 [Pseudomassariella vexata]ORY67214.1 hypothetical protein BCR38DRAFT_509936 [Pseudomassariella vexata]
MQLGGVEPVSVSYVEAHGTGTGVGDPVEVRSIRDAFGGPQRDNLLHFGSIKGNIGHTEATAGVVGLIKVLLMMKHGKIPAQASHNALNPKIPPFDQDQMAIPRNTLPWNPPFRLACVNSHGAAGSNSAVMIREKPSSGTPASPVHLSKYPLFVSAGSASSLSINIQDLESTLQAASSYGSGIQTAAEPKPVVLVFGGQESNFIGLSDDIYRSSKVFRYHLDFCNDLLISRGLESFYPSIFQTVPVRNLTTLHSALFAIQYASAKAWMDCGLKISAVVGHSFGQLTALCISGALSLPDALALVAGRASIMMKHWGPEPGSMMFLQADRQTVDQVIRSLRTQHGDHYVEVACYNGPRSHVVVGSSKAVDALEQHVANTLLLRDSVRTKRLKVTHGFHSKFTESMLPHLTALAKELVWKSPSLHLETCDDHTRRPVFFQRAIERLAKRFPQSTWIEAGRRSSVIQLVKGSVPDSQCHAFLSPQLTSSNGQGSLADVTIDLWRNGYATQYWAIHRDQKPEYGYLSLPPHQFEKTRHWLPFTGRGLEEEAKSDAAMLGGHVMAGQTLAPASLYFEVVARAALFLQKDTEAKKYVPTVNDLLMKSPIGQDTTKEIMLTLKRLEDVRPSWPFSMTTQATGGPIAAPFEQSTGRVCLKKRDDAQAAQEFKRFESLTGHRRYEELLNHPDAEKIQGNHIYRAFNTVVHYGEAFRGIKQVACVRMEAAGKVAITPNTNDPADQRLCDTPMTDSFMQFAGFVVNYFNNPSMEDVLVCMKIEHIEMGGGFNPDAKEWIVYSNMSEGGEADASSDAYVFEAASKKMVMAAFGFRFSKMPQALPARMLKSVNKSGVANTTLEKPVVHAVDKSTAPAVPAVPTRKSSSKRPELRQVLSSVTDIPLEELRDDSTLDELGIDSLMATEVLNDIRSVLGLTIDLTSFLFFPNIQTLVTHVDEKLGVGGEDDGLDSPPSPSTDSGIADVGMPNKALIVNPEPPNTVNLNRPTITSALDAFQETRFGYDQLAQATQALGFWAQAYPHQARLVLAYVVEAFTKIGCDLKELRAGDSVPRVGTLDKHKKLVRQLYRILEDGKLILSSNQGFSRTDVPVDSIPAEAIYQQIIGLYPQHANVNNLVRTVASQMAACLVGDKDGLQIVFGDRETKKTLEDMYEFWPLLRTPTLLLGDFLLKAFTNATGSGKFRILEIGAGTGGTTRYIVNHLKNHGIPFEYVFTDISASFVAAARKQFNGVDGMSFELLDVEKPPKAEYESAFHCIIATNCIHATRNLDSSLLHLRKMLREDGALTLVEITKNMFWLDIVVGLFEGFNEVLWTDGAAPESKTVRVIGAFPAKKTVKTVKAALETVVYKKIGDQEIHADVYYPVDGEFPNKKMPVGSKPPVPLLVLPSSHIIFSRKDIRPAQTRLLLEKGFLPVSLDHRLCPEVSLSEGPMVDVCDALHWTRNTLPHIKLKRPGLEIDGDKVVAVGWSSGGQLAMSLAWTAHPRGLRPPEAILAFYCATNYEDEWWRCPIQPVGAEDRGIKYDVLEAVQDEPITNYGVLGAWEPLSDPHILTDPRCRIVLHINWKAQTLPVILGGLVSRKKAAAQSSDVKDWNLLPQPTLDQIRAASPLAQIRQANYQTPTFLIHGTADDLIPWQQSRGTYEAMVNRGIAAGLALVEGAPHICDLSSDPESEGWKAALRGYDFISSYVF